MNYMKKTEIEKGNKLKSKIMIIQNSYKSQRKEGTQSTFQKTKSMAWGRDFRKSQIIHWKAIKEKVIDDKVSRYPTQRFLVCLEKRTELISKKKQIQNINERKLS